MRVLVFSFAIACSSNHQAPQPARTGPPLACELRSYTIRSVSAYMERDGRSKVGASRLRGAELFVEAQPGLTAEWLHLQLERHIQAARTATPTADCPLDVDDPQISVASSGTGFVVRVTVDEEEVADEILRRARRLGSPAR